MTEKEISERDKQLDPGCCLAAKSGSFFIAIGDSAFALSRVTGYRVMRRRRKAGAEIMSLGFPVGKVEQVKEKIIAAGGKIVSSDDDSFVFSGIDGSSDGMTVAEPATEKRKSQASPMEEIYNSVMSFDISRSTPLDAFYLIVRLQGLRIPQIYV